MLKFCDGDKQYMRASAASMAVEGILHMDLYKGKSGEPSPPKKLLYCALHLCTSARHTGESLFLYQVHLSLCFTFLNS